MDKTTWWNCCASTADTNKLSGISADIERHGLGLLPQLYAHLNQMPFEAAVQMDKDLAVDLRRAGYMVLAGIEPRAIGHGCVIC